MAYDFYKQMSDAESKKRVEQPDNSQHTGMYAEEMQEAAGELRRRGYSKKKIRKLSIGEFSP